MPGQAVGEDPGEGVVSPRRPGVGVLLLILLWAGGAGCTLEPREGTDEARPVDELRAEDGAAVDTFPVDSAEPRDPAEAVSVLLEVFREATRVGDLSLALSLLDREAILLDEEVPGGTAGPLPAPGATGPTGETAEERTRGEFVVEMRRRHADGLRFRVDAQTVRMEGPHALVLTLLRVEDADPDDPEASVELGRVLETAVLRGTDDGWRILHLHRSRHRADD